MYEICFQNKWLPRSVQYLKIHTSIIKSRGDYKPKRLFLLPFRHRRKQGCMMRRHEKEKEILLNENNIHINNFESQNKDLDEA